MNCAQKRASTSLIIALVLLLAVFGLLGQELQTPKFRVLYWSGGVLDSLIYQPRNEGIDAYVCHNGYWPTDGIYCDSINYGYSPQLAMKEDWHWTRRSFIRFDTTLATYDSLETCQIWLYKYGTATNSNWIQAYLVTGAWEEATITWDTAPTVNITVASDQWTPAFPDWEGWFSLDISTLYENWVAGPNYGLQLRQQDLDSNDGQEVYSSDMLFCSLSIDSLWLYEETDCDGENLVEICYEANDGVVDSFFTDFRLTDLGTPVPVHTILETVPGYAPPNIGWVNSGTHCFYWDMHADYPEHEGCNFEIEISAHNQTLEILTVTDSFAITDAEGVAWDGEFLRVTRSWYSSPLDTQRVFRVDPFTHEVFADSCNVDDLFDGYTADCEWHDGYLWILGGGLSAQRAKLFKFDVSTCTIVDSSAAVIPPTRWGQGIAWHGSHFYATDSRGKIYEVDPTPPYTSTLWLDLETLHPGLMDGAISADALVFALGSIWILRNPGPAGHVLLQFDFAGNVIDSFALSATTGFGPEGITFDGSCFWYTDHAKDFVYRVCLWACDDTSNVMACLDSKNPTITAICLPEPVYAGDMATANWLIDDLFTGDIPGSLIVTDGTIHDVYSTSGTSADFSVPATCESLTIIVVQPDSFCNWGRDSCKIAVCNPFDVAIECAPCGGTSSCPDQSIRYNVIDTLCSTSPFAAYFTVKVFSSPTDSVVIYPVGPSSDVIFTTSGDSTTVEIRGIPYTDGDSIWASLDSLETESGCITSP